MSSFTVPNTFKLDLKFETQFKDRQGNFQTAYWFVLAGRPETDEQRWTGFGLGRFEVVVSKETYDLYTVDSLFELNLDINYRAPKIQDEPNPDQNRLKIRPGE